MPDPTPDRLANLLALKAARRRALAPTMDGRHLPNAAEKRRGKEDADAIRAALADGTLTPEDLGTEAVTVFVRGDDGVARPITAYLPKEAPDD